MVDTNKSSVVAFDRDDESCRKEVAEHLRSLANAIEKTPSDFEGVTVVATQANGSITQFSGGNFDFFRMIAGLEVAKSKLVLISISNDEDGVFESE